MLYTQWETEMKGDKSYTASTKILCQHHRNDDTRTIKSEAWQTMTSWKFSGDLLILVQSIVSSTLYDAVCSLSPVSKWWSFDEFTWHLLVSAISFVTIPLEDVALVAFFPHVKHAHWLSLGEAVVGKFIEPFSCWWHELVVIGCACPQFVSSLENSPTFTWYLPPACLPQQRHRWLMPRKWGIIRDVPH